MSDTKVACGQHHIMKRRRASRRRYRRPHPATVLALVLALLVGLLVTRSAGLLAPRRGRAGASSKRGARTALAPLLEAAPGRRFPQRLPLAAYLVGISIVLVLARAGAGGAIDSMSPRDLGIYQSMPETVRACEVQTDASYASVLSAEVTPDSGLAVSRSPQAEPDVAKTPPVEKVKAASAAQGSVHQAGGGPAVATSGIATWYGGGDGFGPEDKMADGSLFNPNDPTIAASNNWPLGTWLAVCHGERCIRVCVRDRGNFGHALDLSMGAFALLAPLSSGVIDVTVEVTS